MSKREQELEQTLVTVAGERDEAIRQRDHAKREAERLRFPRLRPVLSDDRPRDFLGRGLPRRVDAPLLLRAIPGLASQFRKKVPDEFWSGDVHDGETVAILACPCGQEPSVSTGGFRECECGRVYLFTGERVHVGYGEDFDGTEDDPKEVTPEPSVS